jgi:hypothetical protein
MIHDQYLKVVRLVEPVAIVDNTSWTSQEVDTNGFDYASIVFHLGATDIAMVAMKVRETDTSGTGQADISGADFATATNLDIDGSAAALPTADDDNKFWRVDLDLRKRKRYLDVVMTAGDGTTGTYAVAICILGRAGQGPNTSAECGCAQVLRA